jgi:uroporphyrinogen-III synthase
MGQGLQGKRIAIGASRKLEEMSALIEKQGGIPVIRSLQGTIFFDEKKVEPELKKLIEEGADWVILTTGLGTDSLLNLAENLCFNEQFVDVIHQAKVAARGYKTLAVLKKLEVTPIAIDHDGTVNGLIHSLESYDFSGQRVMVQLHGETAPALIQFLESRGATVLEILPYVHIPPEPETVGLLCKEFFSSELDAICFTTAIQVRSLFTYAKENDCVTELLSAFKEHTLAVAVGKVTADALRKEGVERIIVPELERMGAMVIELARYYESKD